MTSEAREQSRDRWDEMAPGWERNRDFMWETTRHVAEWLVDRIQPREGDTILDLAGGPGENGFLAAERVGPSGKVIETDFAPRMVEVAQRLAARRGLTNVETRVLDAENMDLADDSVDGIVCRWGFMLMLDPQTAMKECRRVLKEGRRMSFSVWGAPDKNPWVTVTGMTMMQLGRPPAGDPFGPGGMFSLADHEAIRSMATTAGFSEIEIEEMPVSWDYGSFDEAWAFMTQVAGAIASAIKEMPPEEITLLKSTLETNLQPFATDGALSLPGRTINAVVS